MSNEPLPDDLRVMLGAERERADLDAARLASLFERMTPLLGVPDGPPAPEPSPHIAQPEPGIALRLLQKYPVGSLLAALAIGASGGAAITHLAEAPPLAPSMPAPTVAAPSPMSAPALAQSAELPRVAASASITQPVPVQIPTVAPLSPSAARPDATGTRDADLAVERTLIERARSAMIRGNHQDALAATREHAQRFPSGRFAEERDFITLRALAASGDKARARAAADAFRKHHPQSLLLPGVDEVAP